MESENSSPTEETEQGPRCFRLSVSLPDYMHRAVVAYCKAEKVRGMSQAVQRCIYEALKDRRGIEFQDLALIFGAELTREKIAREVAGGHK